MSISSLFIWPLFESHDRCMVMLILVKQEEEKSRKVVLIIEELVCVLFVCTAFQCRSRAPEWRAIQSSALTKQVLVSIYCLCICGGWVI